MATTTTPDGTVTSLQDKARELSQFVLDSADYAAAQGKIDIFDGDETAQELYKKWRETEMLLQRKHQEGGEITDSEIKDLESKRDAAIENSVVADFAEAENSLNEMFSTVVKVLQRSLQNGAVPTDEEMDECCGSGG